MGRRNFNDGQEIILEDLNGISQALERQMYEKFGLFLLGETEDAFFGGSFKVSYSSSTSVTVASGMGIMRDNAQSSPESKIRPLFLSSARTLNIEAPDLTHPRKDLVCVRHLLVNEITGTRNYKNPTTSVISQDSFTLQKDWGADTIVVQGTPAGSPSEPAVPSGYIKISVLDIAAVSGMSGAGDVSDERSLMPVGALATIDTTGFDRLTEGVAVSLETLFADIDALLKNGLYEYIDLDDLSADPAAPIAADKQRLYFKDDVLYRRGTGGTATPVGGGGGGGGALEWNGPAGSAPVRGEEFGQQVSLFPLGDSAKEVAFVKVPESYISGRQVSGVFGFYSPNNANEFQVRVTATLIRKNLDAMDSVVNQLVVDSADLVNTVANMMRSVSLNISSASGQINAVGISAGDLIKLEFERTSITDGSDDTEDLRFVRGATEIKFG